MKKIISADATVRELGERLVVSDITRKMRQSEYLLDGFGHDAAFIDFPKESDEVLVVNTDRSGINAAYKFGLAGPECVGDLGVSHAVSDVVVAGGVPRAITVALLLPADSSIGFVRGVMEGAQLAAERYGAFIVGGDTKQNASFAMVVTVIGSAKKSQRILRSGARPGDALVVTGYLGSMLLGMMVYGKNHVESIPIDDRTRAILEDALIMQRPPFRLGRAISEAGVVRAGIDISDGLPGAIHAICGASGVGALVDESLIPLHPELKGLISASGLAPLQLSAAGGDWQYLYAIDPDGLAKLEKIATSQGDVIRVIGTVVEHGVTAVRTVQGAWCHLERLEHDSFADGVGGLSHFEKIQASIDPVHIAIDHRVCERIWSTRKWGGLPWQ